MLAIWCRGGRPATRESLFILREQPTDVLCCAAVQLGMRLFIACRKLVERS